MRSSVGRLYVPFLLSFLVIARLTRQLTWSVPLSYVQLPFWWFAKILLDSLLTSSSPGAPAFQLGENQFKAKGVTYRDVLESARVFSRAGEGRGFA